MRSRPPAPNFDFAPRSLGFSSESKAHCGTCGTINDAGNRFCSECGAPLGRVSSSLAPSAPAADPSCPRCGAVTGRGLSFCGSCGFDLSGRHSLLPRNPTVVRSARLVVIAQDGSPGRGYDLHGSGADIGASDGDILLPSDPFISPRHARIVRNNNRFWVRDLDSVNGIYIRLQRPHILEHGDLLLIGLEVLRFELLKGNEAGFGHAMERGIQLFGSPIAPRYAKLCQRTVEGVTRDVYHLCREETVIGREGGDIIFASDPFMSRRHASVTRDPHSKVFTVRDLGSSNGTFLAIRGEVELNHGDLIRIGQHLFRFDVE